MLKSFLKIITLAMQQSIIDSRIQSCKERYNEYYYPIFKLVFNYFEWLAMNHYYFE